MLRHVFSSVDEVEDSEDGEERQGPVDDEVKKEELGQISWAQGNDLDC